MGAGVNEHGARSAGVDGLTVRAIKAADGVEEFLAGLREQLKTGQYVPSPVKERLIPKSPGTYRRLGIPTVADRVVQASLVLVLEPIFEATSIPPPTGSDPGGGPWTRSPKSRCSPPALMSGFSRGTSRHVSTRSTTRS